MQPIFRTIIFSLLSVATGVLFLYSAYTKLFPIQTFEYTLVEHVHMPWWMAGFASRLLIGMEAGLGLLLALNVFGRNKWVLKFSLLVLMLFNIYLVYLWAAMGNDVNCGCFGDAIWMSPSSSLIKNAIIMAVLALLLKFYPGITPGNSGTYFYGLYHARRTKGAKKMMTGMRNFSTGRVCAHLSKIIGVALIALTFILFPIPFGQPDFLKKDSYHLDLSAIYESAAKTPPAVDVRKGKHIIAFMSLTCPHCKIAAYKMELMRKDNPDISMLMVLNGDSTSLPEFWKKTQAKDIPHTMLLGSSFIELSGPSFPAIFWINDGWVEAKSTYIDMNQADIEKWIADKNPPQAVKQQQ